MRFSDLYIKVKLNYMKISLKKDSCRVNYFRKYGTFIQIVTDLQYPINPIDEGTLFASLLM